MMDLVSEEMRRNPFPVYERIRSVTPVLHEPTADLYMVFGFDGVKRALSDHETFSSSLQASASQSTPEWLIFFDPPRQTKLRALILRAFTSRVVAGLEPRIRELSRRLLDRTIERGEMDLAEDFAIPLPMMVIAEMIGIPSADWPRFRRWSDVILKLSYTVADAEETAKAATEYREVNGEMSAYLPAMIEQRRAAPQADLLTKLVEAEVDGEHLTEAEILGFVQLLLVAGNETTTNLINNTVLCLLDHPDQRARLQAEPDLLPAAIEEALRYRSPVQWMFRGTRREVELGGQVIPAGKLVLPVIGSANRDPGHFPEAERFDIGRDPNPHIAFGHGIHFCIGAPLSRLEARIALTDLLERLKGFERTTDQPWEPRKALHVHGPARLPIRFTPGPRSSTKP